MKQQETVTDVGVIVARFQIDKLHEGHMALIDHVTGQHSKVIVFLGLSPLKCTYEDPLDFECRKLMLQELYPDINILYIKDMKSDIYWSKKLDGMIKDVTGPDQTVTLYGGRSSFIDRYHGKHICIEMEQTSYESGSKRRKQISNLVKASKKFRQGVIWGSANRYINPIPCIDAIILNEDGDKMLLAKKPNEDEYRFVGGHVDPRESLEDTVKREVFEETCLEVGDIKYLGSAPIDDWRHKGKRSSIISTLFQTKRIFGNADARDDIEELKWFTIDELKKSYKTLLVTGHIPLFEIFISNL